MGSVTFNGKCSLYYCYHVLFHFPTTRWCDCPTSSKWPRRLPSTSSSRFRCELSSTFLNFKCHFLVGGVWPSGAGWGGGVVLKQRFCVQCKYIYLDYVENC